MATRGQRQVMYMCKAGDGHRRLLATLELRRAMAAALNYVLLAGTVFSPWNGTQVLSEWCGSGYSAAMCAATLCFSAEANTVHTRKGEGVICIQLRHCKRQTDAVHKLLANERETLT